MTKAHHSALGICVLLFAAIAARAESQLPVSAPLDPQSTLQRQVAAAETAFAQTMADRDHQAFASFVSDEAVFLGGSVLRGRQAVADGWRGLFEGDTAPFSWKSETVEVVESGDLALSTGPVFDAEGNQISIFTSIWRQEEPGVWRVLFDRGTKYCR